ncbi:MAG TPA: flagellar hook-basal body complex protein FliE [Verrucomicrobiae bacterium]|jgi:flagellar hook-basal body complex protein FliE|nr:flagellar hook-basal body complex protein FliE [Verrucomicrobiae bacterium]
MRVEALIPDGAANIPVTSRSEGGEFARALDALSQTLDGAQSAEDAFAAGAGSLQDAVYLRARADVTLAAATAATSRVVQAVQSLLSMQV